MNRLRLMALLGCGVLIAAGALAQSMPTSTLTGKVIAEGAAAPRRHGHGDVPEPPGQRARR